MGFNWGKGLNEKKPPEGEEKGLPEEKKISEKKRVLFTTRGRILKRREDEYSRPGSTPGNY